MPFTERAEHKWESPRRSSTRHNRRVDPFGSSVAPALNTLFIEYGQSLLVRMGLAGCRKNKASYLFIGAFMEALLRMKPILEVFLFFADDETLRLLRAFVVH